MVSERKHQEIMVPDDFLIGKKESGTKRHHQGICPWFHCFFSPYQNQWEIYYQDQWGDPLGDQQKKPLGKSPQKPVGTITRNHQEKATRNHQGPLDHQGIGTPLGDHQKKPLGKSHQKPLGTMRPLGNWDTIRTPLEETIRTPLGHHQENISTPLGKYIFPYWFWRPNSLMVYWSLMVF